MTKTFLTGGRLVLEVRPNAETIEGNAVTHGLTLLSGCRRRILLIQSLTGSWRIAASPIPR